LTDGLLTAGTTVTGVPHCFALPAADAMMYSGIDDVAHRHFGTTGGDPEGVQAFPTAFMLVGRRHVVWE
jgi:hypothetical protein